MHFKYHLAYKYFIKTFQCSHSTCPIQLHLEYVTLYPDTIAALLGTLGMDCYLGKL